MRRRVGISHGTAVYHLRALEHAGFVRCTRVGAFTTYFATGQPLEDETYGLSPADRAVLSIVVDAPGIALADLNTDGLADVVATNRTFETVAVLLAR